MLKITRRQRSSSRTKLAASRAQLMENLQILQKQQQTQQMLSNLSKIRSFRPPINPGVIACDR
jgi:hypothetical protein